jgi:hypothetical protein
MNRLASGCTALDSIRDVAIDGGVPQVLYEQSAIRNWSAKTLLYPFLGRQGEACRPFGRRFGDREARRTAKTGKKAGKTHRLTSGASFPPRLLISWMIEVVVVMLQTRIGSEVAPERECERWIGNKRFPGGGTRPKTASENGRLRVGPDRTNTRDSPFSPYCEVRTGAAAATAAAPPLLIFSGGANG